MINYLVPNPTNYMPRLAKLKNNSCARVWCAYSKKGLPIYDTISLTPGLCEKKLVQLIRLVNNLPVDIEFLRTRGYRVTGVNCTLTLEE